MTRERHQLTPEPARTTTETQQHQQQLAHSNLKTQTFKQTEHIKMAGQTLLLLCVALFICSDAEGKSRLYRRPSCVGAATQACPLNYSPVCGSNGLTYPNECALCIHRLEKNADILIMKDGPC